MRPSKEQKVGGTRVDADKIDITDSALDFKSAIKCECSIQPSQSAGCCDVLCKKSSPTHLYKQRVVPTVLLIHSRGLKYQQNLISISSITVEP